MKTSLILVSLIYLSLCSACGNSSQAQSAADLVPSLSVDPRLLRSQEALQRLPEHLAASVYARIQANSDEFFGLLEDAWRQSASQGDFMQLVDKQHSLGADYEPQDLVSLEDYRLDLARKPMYLRRVVIEDLQAMVDEARRSGITLLISSTYRSYDYQRQVYARHVGNMGQAAADLVSARPGHSQHQLGTAIDFGSISDAFAQTAAGRWMAEHGWRFGFSLSYPQGMTEVTGYSWESWHFRYIGRAASRLERDYFDGIQQYLMLFWDAYFTGT